MLQTSFKIPPYRILTFLWVFLFHVSFLILFRSMMTQIWYFALQIEHLNNVVIEFKSIILLNKNIRYEIVSWVIWINRPVLNHKITTTDFAAFVNWRKYPFPRIAGTNATPKRLFTRFRADLHASGLSSTFSFRYGTISKMFNNHFVAFQNVSILK